MREHHDENEQVGAPRRRSLLVVARLALVARVKESAQRFAAPTRTRALFASMKRKSLTSMGSSFA
jgi:hypothetical protein